MADDIENLILEHLRALRGELRDFRMETTADLAMMKLRLTSLESQVASIHTDMALIHGRIDRVDAHIDRIEQRLAAGTFGSSQLS